MDDPDLIPLSALQHYLYCPRQCALIHVEREWTENERTAEGRLLHERTDVPAQERRRGVRTVTAMPLRSRALGVAGIADVVEIREEPDGLRPFPVEYKRGRPKAHRADEVQLCAQGIALEEMFKCVIPEGALFYGESRRRMVVAFDPELRALTQNIAAATRSMIEAQRTPPPVYEKRKCGACSLASLCRPRLPERPSVARWLAREIEA